MNKKIMMIASFALATVSMQGAATFVPGKPGTQQEVKQEVKQEIVVQSCVTTPAPVESPLAQEMLQNAQENASEKYADKVLKQGASFKGFVGRLLAKSIMLSIFSGITNENIGFALVRLAEQGLIAGDYWLDAQAINAHKDATWGQLIKTNDAFYFVDYSDHVSTSRKVVQTFNPVGWILLDAPFELVRQQFINAHESPRKANCIKIILQHAVIEALSKFVLKSQASTF